MRLHIYCPGIKLPEGASKRPISIAEAAKLISSARRIYCHHGWKAVRVALNAAGAELPSRLDKPSNRSRKPFKSGECAVIIEPNGEKLKSAVDMSRLKIYFAEFQKEFIGVDSNQPG